MQYRIKVWMNFPYSDITCVQKFQNDNLLEEVGSPVLSEVHADFFIDGQIRSNVIFNTLTHDLEAV